MKSNQPFTLYPSIAPEESQGDLPQQAASPQIPPVELGRREHSSPTEGEEQEEDIRYRDFAEVPIIPVDPNQRGPPFLRGGRLPFPGVLYQLLEEAEREGFVHICGWETHGRSFRIRHRDLFESVILTRYFRGQSGYAAFHRQLNMYGFQRITRNGPDHGSIYHERFLRGRPDLAVHLERHPVKGTEVRQKANPTAEPNFRTMKVLLPATTMTLNESFASLPIHQGGASELGDDDTNDHKKGDSVGTIAKSAADDTPKEAEVGKLGPETSPLTARHVMMPGNAHDSTMTNRKMLARRLEKIALVTAADTMMGNAQDMHTISDKYPVIIEQHDWADDPALDRARGRKRKK